MKDIKVNELNEATKSDEIEMTDEEMGQVKGGIGLLLPAVQKVREAALTGDPSKPALGKGKVPKTFLGGGLGDE